MGMFDWVRCNAKLPRPEPMDGLFQTKDGDQRLHTFTIESDGSLWIERKNDDGTRETPAPSDFSGPMTFYGHTRQTGRMKEYQAQFHAGQMTGVQSVERQRLMRTEVTREEFLAQRPARDHDEEYHDANGATCLWQEGGKTFEEWQPDLGPVRWWITE